MTAGFARAACRALCTAAVWAAVTPASAQNEQDLLRYSYLETTGGSFRYMGLGGAGVALGADLGAAGHNPAGLGVYRRGDLGMSFGVDGRLTTTTMAGPAADESTFSGSMPNIGIALTYPSIDPDWAFSTLAITYHQRAAFSERFEVPQHTSGTSLLDVFRDQATGYANADLESSALPFTAGPAWLTYLLDPDPAGGPTDYITAIPNGGVDIRQEVQREGRYGETEIAFATGFRNTLFGGITLSVPNVRFSETARYRESVRQDTLDLSEWTYTEVLDVEGSGVSAKLGILWHASDWLRLGGSFHLPTRLKFQETYATTTSSVFRDNTSYSHDSPVNSFDYIVRTPGRVLLGAAFILGDFGILSADYERVDHRGGRLRPTAASDFDRDSYFDVENEAADRVLAVSHAARVGLELRVTEQWRVRFGAGQETSPYSAAADIQSDATRYSGSFGVEWRKDRFYLGGAFRRSWYSGDYYLNNPELTDPAQIARVRGLGTIGAGVRL
jgi:hypothetical protein